MSKGEETVRLTLRTLLAYLDDILDPQDAKQLRNKIEDSEFATSLVHQIRGSVKRLRLDAPALDAQGIGGDLNSVAEYLDNVLPPEEVPALEKACLDSEVHLGEVAACHQVLTLVLGAPADVNDRMRQRAYSIAPTIDGSTQPHTEPSSQFTSHPPHPGVPAPVSSGIAETVGRAAASQPNTARRPHDTQVPSATNSEVQRSEQPGPSIRVPSTREIWRAEAQQGLHEAVPPEVDALSESTSTATTPQPSDYASVKERRSSWLRSLAVSTLVVLLILAGIMFATVPIDSSLLAPWFGAPTVVVDRDSGESNEVSRNVNDEISESIEAQQVDPNEVAAWVEQPTDQELAEGQTLVSNEGTISPADRDASGEVSLLPQPAPESRFSERPLELSDLGAAEIDSTHDLDSRVKSAPETTAVLVPDKHDTESTFADESTTFTPPPTPGAQDNVDVPPAPVASDRLATPSLEPRIPNLDDIVPLVDPGIDLQPADVSPPVASPAPDSIVAGAADTTRSPTDEPSVPDPIQAPTLPTVKPRGAEQQLLLQFNPNLGDWQRVSTDDPLELGSQLVGMPAFRVQLAIGSSLVCHLVDAARLSLGPMADLTLQEGRFLLTSEQGGQVQGVQFDERRFEVEMPHGGTTVALEAVRTRLPGAELSDPPLSYLRVYAINEPAIVRMEEQVFEIDQEHQLLAFGTHMPRIDETSRELPRWATSDSVFGGDRHAVRAWNRELDRIDDIRTWLRAKAQQRYGERALAARGLAELDEFAPIVSALNDAEQHAYWEQHFYTLRRALNRGQDSIELLELELGKAHGDRAAFMIEMIAGFSERQLAAGAAAKLVKYLHHNSLDHRVLAIQNLKSITGYSLAFRPEKPLVQRQGVVRKWMGRLSTGRVTYKRTPEVVSLLESFTSVN